MNKIRNLRQMSNPNNFTAKLNGIMVDSVLTIRLTPVAEDSQDFLRYSFKKGTPHKLFVARIMEIDSFGRRLWKPAHVELKKWQELEQVLDYELKVGKLLRRY